MAAAIPLDCRHHHSSGCDEIVSSAFLPRGRQDMLLTGIHAMSKVELGAARVSTNFGLQVSFGAMSTWVHGGDGLRSLRTPSLARKLQEVLDADGEFWQRLIRRSFLDNPHRVTVIGRADAEYDKKLEAAEDLMVKAAAATLSEEQKLKIVEESVALQASQDSEQDPSVLPTLIVAEVCLAVPAAAATVH